MVDANEEGTDNRSNGDGTDEQAMGAGIAVGVAIGAGFDRNGE